jgi:hypothetical protein
MLSLNRYSFKSDQRKQQFNYSEAVYLQLTFACMCQQAVIYYFWWAEIS